ncbi:MAG: SulP family inorganic anion transporter [Planctomycetota bacterium]|nr:SulP family inorganic anion transporter [Planctomycetota bacterium]
MTADVLAGITVGLVLVPQAMAYAALAGMPPIYGLYAGSFACMAGGLFGRCAQLQTGPVAMTSLISFAAVAPLAAAGSEDFISLMAILAIMVGAFRIVLGLMRGAVLATLISKPVLIGFGTAAGIIIAATQVPKLFLVDPGFSNPVLNSMMIVGHLPEVHVPSLLMGMGSLVAMILFKRFAPRWPGLLISLMGAGLVSWLINYEGMGGSIVGALPVGLPPLSIPTLGWSHATELIGGALLVVVIGLLEVMTVTAATERKLGVATDLDKELLGQGAASLVAGVTAGFPVSGSLSRSSLNLMAGARTGLSSVVSGLVVLLTLLVLTPLLRPLPYPTLAAAIVMAVSALVRPQDLVRTWRIRKSDALFGFITLAATICAAPSMVIGMEVGIGMSVGYGLWRWMHPRVVMTAPECDGRAAAAADQQNPLVNICDGRLVIRVDSRISFLNAQGLSARIRELARPCPAQTVVVINACAINDLDATGVEMLADLALALEAREKRLVLADVKLPVRKRLQAHDGMARVALLPHPSAPLAPLDQPPAEAT